MKVREINRMSNKEQIDKIKAIINESVGFELERIASEYATVESQSAYIWHLIESSFQFDPNEQVIDQKEKIAIRKLFSDNGINPPIDQAKFNKWLENPLFDTLENDKYDLYPYIDIELTIQLPRGKKLKIVNKEIRLKILHALWIEGKKLEKDLFSQNDTGVNLLHRQLIKNIIVILYKLLRNDFAYKEDIWKRISKILKSIYTDVIHPYSNSTKPNIRTIEREIKAQKLRQIDIDKLHYLS